MLVWIFLMGFIQFAWSDTNPLHAHHNANYVFPPSKGSLPHLLNSPEPSPHVKYNGIDTNSNLGITAYIDALKARNEVTSKEVQGNVFPQSAVTQQDIIFPSSITQPLVQTTVGNGFGSGVGFNEVPLPVQTEVITKPNFVVQPIIETIQKPNFVVQDNVIGVQKPEYIIQEVQEILRKPEFVVQEELFGTIDKPTFLVQDELFGIVPKPGFTIQEEIEFIMRPDFQVEEMTEIIPKPVFVVEENVVPVQKPTFSVQNIPEIIQKPEILINTVPVTIVKPEYQIEEDIIPVPKPSFLIQETQETVVKPEFVITEEIVPVPKPNFLIQDDVQVVQKPNFILQNIIETVQRPEYTVHENTIVVDKPNFSIEEITETVVKPLFVEQEVPVTVVNPHFSIEEQLVHVPKPQFVVQEEVVHVIKPEFNVQEVTEVITKPEYLVEDVSVLVEKPSYVIEDTPVVVQKPNYVIEEVVETVTKPEYVIQDSVELITKPEFVIQESVVETIVKPKFVVVSASNPKGEVFDISKYNVKPSAATKVRAKEEPPKHITVVAGHSSTGHPKQTPTPLKSTIIPEVQKLLHLEGGSQAPISPTIPYHLHQSFLHKTAKPETLVIHPSLKPQIIDVIEEFSSTESVQVPLHASHPHLHHHHHNHYQSSTIAIDHSEPRTVPVAIPHHPEIVEVTSQYPTINHLSKPLAHPHALSKSLTLAVEEIQSTSTPKSLQHQQISLPQNHLHTVPLPAINVNQIPKIGHEHGVLAKSNEFLEPHHKIKKDISKSEQEEFLEALHAFHDLMDGSDFFMESGALNPKYEYLLQDQNTNDSNPKEHIEPEMQNTNQDGQDGVENEDDSQYETFDIDFDPDSDHEFDPDSDHDSDPDSDDDSDHYFDDDSDDDFDDGYYN